MKNANHAPSFRKLNLGAAMKSSFWSVFALLLLGFECTFAGTFEDGVAAFEAKDSVVALRLLVPLAEQGDRQSQFIVGSIYYRCIGVPQN